MNISALKNNVDPNSTQVTGSSTPNKKYSLDVTGPTEDLVYDQAGSTLYVGTATIGSQTSQPVWKIFRLLNGRLSYASNEYNQIWDNRSGLDYE